MTGTNRVADTERRRHVFVVLDGIRGVAALAVLNWHAADLFGDYTLISSYLAVDLFFVLSGFVIAHAYEGRLREGLSPGGFMLIRLVRLYPLYIVGTIIGIFGAGLQMTLGTGLIWTPEKLLVASSLALVFLPTPATYSRDNDTFPLNGPSWSLFFEIAINLVYALAFRRLTNRVLARLVAGSALLLLVTGIYCGSLDVGFRWEHIWGGVGRVSFSFFAGILAYRLWARYRPTARVPIWLLIPGLLLIFGMRPRDEVRTAFDLVVVLGLFPVLVFVCAAATERGRVAAAYTLLGLASYGIYALHWPLTRVMQDYWREGMPHEVIDFAPWFGLLFAAVVTTAVLILDRYYDRPLRSALLQHIAAPAKKRLPIG